MRGAGLPPPGCPLPARALRAAGRRRSASIAAPPLPARPPAHPRHHAPLSGAGFSLSWGLSSLDPGFTYTPIFQVNDSVVTSLYPGTDGSCRSEFSTSSYFSHSDFKSSLSVQ